MRRGKKEIIYDQNPFSANTWSEWQYSSNNMYPTRLFNCPLRFPHFFILRIKICSHWLISACFIQSPAEKKEFFGVPQKKATFHQNREKFIQSQFLLFPIITLALSSTNFASREFSIYSVCSSDSFKICSTFALLISNDWIFSVSGYSFPVCSRQKLVHIFLGGKLNRPTATNFFIWRRFDLKTNRSETKLLVCSHKLCKSLCFQ